jgi:hypothetical protein
MYLLYTFLTISFLSWNFNVVYANTNKVALEIQFSLLMKLMYLNIDNMYK